MENNVYDIQKNYRQVALDGIQAYQGDFSEKNKKELLQLLQHTEQEFIQKIQSLPKEMIQDTGNRKLLSMIELKHKLIQDIAIKVIGGREQTTSLRSMKQLLTYITGGKSEYITQELVENLNKETEDIPIPAIQGTVEQIGEVILPPDILERLETSFLGGQKKMKKRPPGFDKIGLDW